MHTVQPYNMRITAIPIVISVVVISMNVIFTCTCWMVDCLCKIIVTGSRIGQDT